MRGSRGKGGNRSEERIKQQRQVKEMTRCPNNPGSGIFRFWFSFSDLPFWFLRVSEMSWTIVFFPYIFSLLELVSQGFPVLITKETWLSINKCSRSWHWWGTYTWHQSQLLHPHNISHVDDLAILNQKNAFFSLLPTAFWRFYIIPLAIYKGDCHVVQLWAVRFLS